MKEVKTLALKVCQEQFSSADPEGVEGVQAPLKNHKKIGFLSNTGPDPLKNHKATEPSQIQCRAVTGTPAQRHLNGVSLES